MPNGSPGPISNDSDTLDIGIKLNILNWRVKYNNDIPNNEYIIDNRLNK